MLAYCLRNGVGVAVAVLLVTLFGFLSLFRVPVQMTPDLTPTSISIETTWPGATPQDIEKEILIEQERYLRNIPDLVKMTSTAVTGSASIVLEFRVGTSLQEILVRANNSLSQVPSYPENVDQPRIVTSSSSDEPIAWFSLKPLPGNPQGLDIVAMQDFADDNIRTEFERTPGVSQSELFGGAERQVHVYVDPGKLAERQITIDQLRAAIRARNRDLSGGDFDEGKRRLLIRTVGRFETLADLEGCVIDQRPSGPVYLRDVATVEFSKAEARAQVRHNGEPALAMNARRQPGTNIIQVMDDVKATVKRLNEGLLAKHGLVLKQVSDDTEYIRSSVTMVRDNLLLGGVLAFIVLFLFLRSVPSTLIGALAIPICTVAAFLGLVVTGRTVNVISLAGVAFAIGMTVDNAIVVLENIDRHRQMGKTLWNAALEGTQEVFGAVLASTLTTVFVFLPIVMIQEEAGQLFADIAIAITAAIVASMLVALLVIPSAAVRFLPHRVNDDEAADKLTGWRRQVANAFGFRHAEQWFERTVMVAVRWLLGGVVRRVVLVTGLFCFSILLSILLRPQMEYLPDGSKNVLFAIVFPPAGYNLQEMTSIADDVEKQFVPYVGLSRADAMARGEGIPPITEFFFVTTSQQMFVVALAKEGRDLDTLTPILSERLNRIPGMFSFAIRASVFGGDLSGSRGIDIDITGQELGPIYDVFLPAFLKTMEKISPSVRPEPASLTLGQPLLEIHPDWNRAAELGVNSADLGYAVWALTDGAFLDEFFEADDKIDIFLYSKAGTVKRIGDIANLPLSSVQGRTVPLGSVANVVERASTETIRRVDQKRTVTLTVTPPVNMALETAVGKIQTDVIDELRAEGKLPDSVTMRIAGASDKLAATREALGGNFLLAIIISYLLMVALFQHWGFPLVIMTSVPLGIIGGLVGLAVLNHMGDVLGLLSFGLINVDNVLTPLDVITMLGFVILVGTVVNNPILIVEQTLINMRTGGMDWLEAVSESTRTRIRPIMMSTMTTVFGLSPLVFAPGAGTELYRGLGTVVLFGLFFSTIFTLTFMPSLLSLVLQLAAYLKANKIIPEHLGTDVEQPAELSGK